MSNNNREQLTADLLDAALAQYRQVEPRTGLEERILANLQTERQSLRWFWWQWRPVLASAAVIITLFAVLSLTKRAVRPTSENTRVAALVNANEQASQQEGHPPAQAAQVNQSSAETAVAVVRRMSRKLRITEASAPHLIAQQTSTLASADVRIEDVKIPAVSLAEINIR